MKQFGKFGQKLRKLRKKKGISAKKLARTFNCSPSLIYNVEKDYNQPQPEFIVKTADFFEVSSDYMLGIEEKRIISEGDLLLLYRKLSSHERIVISYLLRLLVN